MSSNRFFDVPEEEKEVHPTARAWLSRIREGQKATFTLWRKRDGLIFKPAKIYLAFDTPRGQEIQHDDWDVDLNEALVRAGVRAGDVPNEAHRLTMMFRFWFSKPEERFGPGFFEAVLVEILREPPLSGQEVIAGVLRRIHVDQPNRDGYGYGDCKDAIEQILRSAARSLVQDLKYPQPQAEVILAEALARYLDERFHITERQMLGWG
ncbi:hypothetical protein WME76_31205 [Sorangium sp. So ce119]|uniref:hypothetical protein n=1 Tax=Sorangium sp. So ce119 TaxID=3133279 RepID=UPI003F5FA581